MMFSFFSLTVTSNFLTRGNKAKQIQNYVIPVSIYFLGFISSTRILSFEHAHSLLLLNECSLTNTGMLYVLSFKYSYQ